MNAAGKTRRALRRRVRTEEVASAGPNGAGTSTFVETFLKATGIRGRLEIDLRRQLHLQRRTRLRELPERRNRIGRVRARAEDVLDGA